MPIPFVRDLIPRAALVGAISSAVKSHRLIIVQGPAGYGKTSIGTQAVAAADFPTVWYTAQPWHSTGFVESLVSEVRSVREDFGRRTLAIAVHGRPATDDANELRLWASRIGSSCAQELGHIRERLVVVVEDYQVLEGDLSFSDVIAGAMHQLPETVSLLLIGRSTPTLPLAEWVAQGRAIQFSAEDLKFNPMETMLLAQKHGIDLDEQRATELCARCEGWPVGISLFVGARPKSASPLDLSEAPLTSILLEQHLATIPSDLIEFLERTATLEVLDVAVLEQFGAMPAARRMLKELERRGEMLTVLRAGASYRLHRLMREAIISRVRDRDGDAAVAKLHAGVANMLEAAGRLAPALFHLERARDDGHLVRFLTTNVDALFADGHGEQVGKVVRELARRGADEPVLVGRVQGMLLRQRGLPGARELFVAALERANERNDDESIFALRTLLLWDGLDDLDPTASSDIVGFVRDAGLLGTRQRTTALVLLGWAKAIEGDFTSAIEKAGAAAELGVAYPELRFRAALLYSYVATCRGDFVRADESMSELLRDLESSEHVVLLCYTLFWYARLSLLWGDINPAADYARQGTTLGRHLNLDAELASVFDVLAEINAGAGERESCMQAIEVVNEHAAAAWYSADRDRLAAHAQQTLARCEFVGGSATGAIEIVRAELERTAPPLAVRAAMMADEALYAVLAARPDAAALLSAATREVTNVVPFDAADACALASAGVLLALAQSVGPDGDVLPMDGVPVAEKYRSFIASRTDLRDLHRLGIALRRLSTGGSSDLAKDVEELAAGYEGLRRRGAGFEAAAVSALLRSIARRRTEVASAVGATQLLFVRDAEDALVRRAVPRGSALTERETEVLSLVALGLTNKEIAQRLGLGRRTVETHVEHVLGKFNAASRTRAVAEAIRAGLLPATSWSGAEDANPA